MMTRRVAQSLILAATLSAIAAAAEPPKQTIGQMDLEGVPAWDAGLRERLLPYLQVRSAGLMSLADDGQSMLVGTRFGSTSQVHLVKTPLGMRKQITFFDEPVSNAIFLPGSKGETIAFGRDIGGNENTQFYLHFLNTGASRMLTDGKSRHENLIASQNGNFLAWTGTARNGKDSDVYIFDMAQDRHTEIGPQIIFLGEGTYSPRSFSPDEKQLLIQKYISERETHFILYDPGAGKTTELTPADRPAYYGGGAWSPDGRALYLTSDRDGEFRKLYRVDVAAAKWDCLTSDIEWDVNSVVVDLKTGGLAFVANENGASKLYFASADGKNRRAAGDLPSGVIGGLQFNRSGGVLGFSLDSWQGPADAYTMSVLDGKLTRWTESEIGGLNPASFAPPKLIQFPTFDEVDGKPRTISAYVYRGQKPGPAPVVIMLHGGPESQYQPTFSGTIQSWVHELGITVIAPNVRGSTGYGKSFHQLDNGILRENSVRDVGALLEWIKTQPELDATRVAVYGGSYGGYMVLGSLVNFPQAFKAGVDIVGIADFTTFLKNTSAYRQDLRRAEYGDERDPAVQAELQRISPLHRAGQIRAALFVLHGKNDPRVPLSEAQQIVAKMRELNRPAWFAVAQNEGHGFRKRENTDLMAILVAHFWQEHLLK